MQCPNCGHEFNLGAKSSLGWGHIHCPRCDRSLQPPLWPRLVAAFAVAGFALYEIAWHPGPLGDAVGLALLAAIVIGARILISSLPPRGNKC